MASGESAQRRAAGYKALLGRLALAHMLAYPLIYLSAMAAMPLMIFLREERLLEVSGQTQPSSDFQRWLIAEVQLTAENAASFEVLIVPVAWLLLGLFLITHASSLPWALAARRARLSPSADSADAERRGRKMWLWCSLSPVLALGLAGLAGWLRILLM